MPLHKLDDLENINGPQLCLSDLTWNIKLSVYDKHMLNSPGPN
jgi:hypothetical protein